MSWYQVKRHPADIIFSQYIRQKANHTCEKCGKVCRVGRETLAQLDASHYWSRSHENTRFDETNVSALCSTCHRRMGGHTREENGEYDLWMKEKLGEEGYNLLKVSANTYKKRDRYMSQLIAKELLNSLTK